MQPDYAEQLNQAVRLLSLRHRSRAAQLMAPLGLHPGQEALLLELDRSGPCIQAQLSEALGCEPPSVTLMTRKLEAAGYIRRHPDPGDRRATVVGLSRSGKALVARIREAWVTLAQESVNDLPKPLLKELPNILEAMSASLDAARRDERD